MLKSPNIDRYGSSIKLGMLKNPARENSDLYVDDNYDTKLSSGLGLYDIY
jgi:hypothetical protein